VSTSVSLSARRHNLTLKPKAKVDKIRNPRSSSHQSSTKNDPNMQRLNIGIR